MKHATPLGDGQWHIGCKLSMPLSDEEKRALLGSGTTPVEVSKPAPEQGRRAWVRYQDTPAAQQDVLNTHRDLGICTGRLRDITNESLSLVLKHHLKVGSLVGIDLGSSDKNAEHLVQVRVVAVAAQQDEWIISCQFTDKLSDEELRSLLA